MFKLLTEKWDEILDFFKKEFEISDVSFKAWIEPLEIHSVHDGMVTLLVKDENIMTGYLQKNTISLCNFPFRKLQVSSWI